MKNSITLLELVSWLCIPGWWILAWFEFYKLAFACFGVLVFCAALNQIIFEIKLKKWKQRML